MLAKSFTPQLSYNDLSISDLDAPIFELDLKWISTVLRHPGTHNNAPAYQI